ncbi:hypothetical protein RCZ04_07720 [Capnocytophaga sp. HP1101]
MNKIPETMLITLWAKATENKEPKPLLRDEKATEVIGKIDYDFSKFKKAKFSQAGVCIRAHLIDEEARTFLNEHPDAVVIQLGTGLDARYERLGSPELTHWYDLDLPEVIAIRRQFFEENEKRSFLEMSLFDSAWIETVKAHHKPILIIVEGVLMYFPPAEVKKFMIQLAESFDEATLLFDMLAYALIGHAKSHDSLSAMEKDRRPEFQWSEKYSEAMQQWSPKLHIAKEYFMSNYDQGRYPFIFRILYKIPYFYRRFNQRVVRLVIR